jgi:hypothetical protein
MGLAIVCIDFYGMFFKLVGLENKAIFRRSLFERGLNSSQGLAATSPGIMCSEGIGSIHIAQKRGGSDVPVRFHIAGILSAIIPIR